MPCCWCQQEADEFEQLANGPRGMKALEAALTDPDHVLTRLINSLDDQVCFLGMQSHAPHAVCP